MNLKSTLILYIVILSAQLTMGQSIEDVFGKGKETYFSFRIQSKDEIHTLTKMISIDNVKGDSVWAYANIPQFIKFTRLGYKINLLPAPGNVQGVVMEDHIDLGAKTTWNFYPTYTAYVDLMNQFQATYPSICQVQTIATLTSGRKIMVAKISDNVSIDEAEPEFLYTSSIHGDETTGYVLMLHLMDYLLSNYGTNTEVTSLVNTMEIYINPLANPDGTYAGGNSTVTVATRSNANGVDMNRNYPDPQNGQHPDGNAWQPETVAFMNFASSRHFVASANFHGGAEVVNYPWDTKAELNADDAWWQYVSHEYVDMARSNGNTSYMTDVTASGITNGYAWYEVNGGRQDYMNYYHHCREVTIELSTAKTLPASSLLTWWNYNYNSLILYMKEALYGIHGIITDASTGLPITAKVFVTGHDQYNTETYSSANLGDYTRLIKAGTYTLEVSAPNYVTKIISNVIVTDHNTVTLNIQLVPNIVNTTIVTAITQTSATSGGDVFSDGGSAVTARGICWATTSYPVISGNHTSDGSGTGVFTSSITGLSSITLYHVRAYATNSSGTYYGDDLTFTTICGNYILPFTENFTNTTLPGCWTQADNQGSGQVWQFGAITGQSPNPILSGNYAYLNSDAYGSGNSQNADLITPTLNLSSFSNVSLQFNHYFKSYSGSSGAVSYSVNNGTSWTNISSFTTTSATNPVAFSQVIAAVAGQANVKFKWNYTGAYGYYWALDAINITGTCTPVPVSISIAPSANPVLSGTSVTFTATPTNGGTTPSYQWKVNGISVGTNNSTYTYVPLNNDAISCVLTSNVPCATGNPATSGLVTMIVNTPLLGVTPSNQDVSDVPGVTSFNVNSNSGWSVVSDQSWCIVNSSGTGNGTIAASYSQNNSGVLRIANITVTVSGIPPVTVTLTQQGVSGKLLNLNIFLEGLFNGNTMNKAKNASGDQYAGTVADRITVELHETVVPYALAGGPYTVNLNTDGNATVIVPVSLGANYYIVVKHRNSIETWTSVPIAFSGPTVSYNFSNSAGQAFGSNLKLVSGKYVIYSGDVNQDGFIDSGDMTPLDNDASNSLSGYLGTDVNGDGIINMGDMTILDSNANNYVGKIVP